MQNPEGQNPLAQHWLIVGYVSPEAQKWIEELGGKVIKASQEPPLLAVALAYNPAGAWTWSRGERQHRQGIEYWSLGELQEASTGITLQYHNSAQPYAQAEYCSAEANYLILPDEEFDAATGAVKEPSAEPPEEEQPQESQAAEDTAPWDDLDDHPF